MVNHSGDRDKDQKFFMTIDGMNLLLNICARRLETTLSLSRVDPLQNFFSRRQYETDIHQDTFRHSLDRKVGLDPS